ncbi:MAG: hypothetical protein AB8B69_03660 [Chitinophagales bacterium]
MKFTLFNHRQIRFLREANLEVQPFLFNLGIQIHFPHLPKRQNPMQLQKYTSIFALCLYLLMAFTSCSKEADNIAVIPVEISAEDFLRTHVNQDILFQFSYTNATTGVANGWLIDKKGQVMTYDLSSESNPTNVTDKGYCTRTDLLSLYTQATSNGTLIEAEELKGNYMQIREAAYGSLSPNQKGSEKEGVSTFYAVAYDTSGMTSVGCGAECENEPTESDLYPYSRIILNQSGTDNRYNESMAANDLVQWLSSIHEVVWQ